MMYQMCLFSGTWKRFISWTILFGIQLLVYTCYGLQPSNIAPYCQHEVDGTSETEQKLTSVVKTKNFCPWTQECNGTCPARCRAGSLATIRGYCTADSISKQDKCIDGVCLCTAPKLTCYKRHLCPCYSDASEEEIGQEECCIYAIDCLMGMGDNTESKTCFVEPDDPNLEVHCHNLAVICKVLEEHFCDNSCLYSTSSETPYEGTTLTSNLSNIGSPGQGNLIVYITVPLVMLILIGAALCVLAVCIRRNGNLPGFEDKIESTDRYTTVDHPHRTECPPKDDRDSNITNPMYDMQIVGDSTLGSTNSMSLITTADCNDNTRSYENISPSTSNPASPTTENCQLLPNSKTSKLGVPVFNALQNKQRGTRSRITFLPRTPSPRPDRKMLPGMSEEYEPISPRTSKGDETIPMLDMKMKTIDSGYENATLSPDGKLKTKLRNSGESSGYENAMLNDDNSNTERQSNIYDYASPIVSTNTANSFSDNEYATPEVNQVSPEVNQVGYNQLKPINRLLKVPNSSSNQYNQLDCSTGVTAVKAENGGEYSQLRREGEEISKTKPALKVLPDVINVGQKRH